MLMNIIKIYLFKLNSLWHDYSESIKLSYRKLILLNTYIRKSLKIVFWFVTSIVLLVVLLALSLNIPVVQNFVKDRAITFLKNKTKTEVSLESIKIALPKDVVLNRFYIADLKGDTLLYAEKLQVDISLFKLLKNTVEVKTIRANVKRINPDTTFNFSFLVDAFMSEEKKDPKKDTTAAPLKFRIDKVLFISSSLRILSNNI